jgi:hypothetical protein
MDGTRRRLRGIGVFIHRYQSRYPGRTGFEDGTGSRRPCGDYGIFSGSRSGRLTDEKSGHRQKSCADINEGIRECTTAAQIERPWLLRVTEECETLRSYGICPECAHRIAAPVKQSRASTNSKNCHQSTLVCALFCATAIEFHPSLVPSNMLNT